MQVFKVAAGIREGTLDHRIYLPNRNWFSQLTDFFDVTDMPVIGYTPSVVLTELHLHLWNCAVDYRYSWTIFGLLLNFVFHTQICLHVRPISLDHCIFHSDPSSQWRRSPFPAILLPQRAPTCYDSWLKMLHSLSVLNPTHPHSETTTCQ